MRELIRKFVNQSIRPTCARSWALQYVALVVFLMRIFVYDESAWYALVTFGIQLLSNTKMFAFFNLYFFENCSTSFRMCFNSKVISDWRKIRVSRAFFIFLGKNQISYHVFNFRLFCFELNDKVSRVNNVSFIKTTNVRKN